MKGLLLNSLKLDGKKYEYKDINGFIPESKWEELFGFSYGFYGGRVKRIAKTKKTGIYLCVTQTEVIDIYIPELKDLTNRQLTEILERKGLEAPAKATKNDLLELLGVELIEEN